MENELTKEPTDNFAYNLNFLRKEKIDSGRCCKNCQ